MRRVVVTGLGLATPLGSDVETVWRRLMEGDVGVGAPRRYGAVRPPTTAIGEIGPEEYAALAAAFPTAAATGDARTLFGVAAGARAFESAGLVPGTHARGAVVLGAGPGVHRPEDVDRHLDGEGRYDVHGAAQQLEALEAESLVRTASDQPAEVLAQHVGAHGPVHAVTTACSASNQALGLAFRLVRRGEADWAIAGGSDSQNNPLGLVFFVLLGAAAAGGGDPRQACRPFDRRRAGLVMGEGAGCAVIESLEHARARGAAIFAEVVGYGASLDAYRTTAPCPDGRGAAEALRAALQDARERPEGVDFVNAHGTGTKRNDPAEVRAIHAVCGEHAPHLAVSSSKGALGHLLAGAAGVAFVLTALAVQRDGVPPTANLTEGDPACDLDFVPGRGRSQVVRVALNNSFAFGGQNACLVLKKHVESSS